MKQCDECSTNDDARTWLEAHIERAQRTHAALRDLYGFSDAEARDFAAMFGDIPAKCGELPTINAGGCEW